MNHVAPASERASLAGLLARVAWREVALHAGLVVVLAVAAYLRFVGLNWDEYTHLHPDERFLTMVETSLRPVASLSEYFRTDQSPLNPHNVGHRFFVYGTLPIFLVRYLAEWLGRVGYDEVHLVGRAASATFDLISVFLVYLVGARLYRRRVGLLAAAFAAFTVLLIQHAHFFVVDSFANTFILAGFYLAVLALEEDRLAHYALFGVALGMATASKANAAPLAMVIVLAALARARAAEPGRRWEKFLDLFGYLVVAALVSLLTFRVFQPYAFAGTSFFDIRLNPDWLGNMLEIRRQLAGEVDFPPALQWADRPPVLFALKNMVFWGMGLPLGLLVWAGWGWAAWRMVRRGERRHLLPVVWTGAYFLWQSTTFTPAMRYQMPVYPTLFLLGAWALDAAWGQARERRWRWGQAAVAGVGLLILAWTAVYAFAFTSIYTRPVTRVAASRWIYTHVPGAVNLVVETPQGRLLEPIPVPEDVLIQPGAPLEVPFTAHVEGRAVAVLLPYARATDPAGGSLDLRVRLVPGPDSPTVAEGQLQTTLPDEGAEARLAVPLVEGPNLQPGQSLTLRLEVVAGSGLAPRRSVIISETSWDDGLPLRIDGRDGYGGLYQGVNQELYWPDDQDDDGDGVSDKLQRIAQTLSQGDYLVITSNRQYGSIARVPQRYPLTTAYYRALFDCPPPKEVWRCAAEARAGEVQSVLGYDLIAVFQNNPRLGPIEWNDQGAEETFTVYDHPKVLIFAKRPDFSVDQVYEVLGEVDVSNVLHAPPKDLEAGSGEPSPLSLEGLLTLFLGRSAGGEPGAPSLMLPRARWDQQRAGGTWARLFPAESPLNRSQVLAVVVWWLTLALLGLAAFPLVRRVFPGLDDAGYPLSRLLGMLALAWGVWMAGSLGVPANRPTILAAAALLAAVGGLAAWRDREWLRSYFRRRGRAVVTVEALALAFFLFDLLIRLGNPDLWHPAKGGEKPMDFSYLNAVLKSTTFPPFDPWFAGGYINYYYFGFVLVGVVIKLLGILPEVAYNLAIPTVYALSALAAYSVASNLVARFARTPEGRFRFSPRLAGIAAALGLTTLGNLGTARLLYEALKQMGGALDAGGLLGMVYALRGLGRFLTFSQPLPIPLDHWYWNPSRAIPPGPGEVGPITEFPFFTFLYADLHAHMLALPLTVAGLAWALSWLLAAEEGRARRWSDLLLGLGAGALVLGALRATNTWDYPTYLGIGALAALAAPILSARRLEARAVLRGVVAAGALVLLSALFYEPYVLSYLQGYTKVDLWRGSRTPLDAYLTIHGLFLFVLAAWFAWETREWMAATPLSGLGRWRRYFGALGAAALAFLVLLLTLAAFGLVISLVVFPMALWAALLFLRPGQPTEKRFVLALTVIGLALTVAVDVVVLRGDIGRMNTVFKFYLQVWTLFSISAATALAWLLADLDRWSPTWRRAWFAGLGALVFAAAMYPATATPAKVRDRMAPTAPHTLDGMAFMPYATYYDLGASFPLAEDYEAIRWLRANVQGSPVIVEANIPEYRWGSRMTIYTGLPGVLGWNWHQRQQRVASGDFRVTERALDITAFYTSPDVETARLFLERYEVRYVVVGRLERLYYEYVQPCWPVGGPEDPVNCDLSGRPVGMGPPAVTASACEPLDPGAAESALRCPTHGLEKFERMVDMGLLRVAYRQGETVIYEVLR